jgi:hypothetical protein
LWGAPPISISNLTQYHCDLRAARPSGKSLLAIPRRAIHSYPHQHSRSKSWCPPFDFVFVVALILQLIRIVDLLVIPIVPIVIDAPKQAEHMLVNRPQMCHHLRIGRFAMDGLHEALDRGQELTEPIVSAGAVTMIELIDALEVFRFSCLQFPNVPGLFDCAEPSGPTRDLTRLAGVAFSLAEKGLRTRYLPRDITRAVMVACF